MLAHGSWFLESKNDPRWNTSGSGLVGMLTIPKECEERIEYWWYNLPKGSIFVHFKADKVFMVRVVEKSKSGARR